MMDLKYHYVRVKMVDIFYRFRKENEHHDVWTLHTSHFTLKLSKLSIVNKVGYKTFNYEDLGCPNL